MTGLSPEGAERSGAPRSEAEGLTAPAAAVRSKDLRTGLPLDWTRAPRHAHSLISSSSYGFPRPSDAPGCIAKAASPPVGLAATSRDDQPPAMRARNARLGEPITEADANPDDRSGYLPPVSLQSP